MTNEQTRHNRALDTYAIVVLVITFLLRYAPFLAARQLFGPFMDNVYIYGPIFSDVSRLSLSEAVPYYLPDIGTGFPVFESPHFSILYPFYFLGLLSYGGPLASLYTLTNLTLFHLFVFYLNLYVLLRCATVPPWAAYVGASVGMLAWNTQLYASWITVTASYSWLPLVLAGGVLLLRFPGKASGIVVFSVAAGLLALASPSQAVIHATLSSLILFAIGAAWLCLRRRFTDIWRLAWPLLVCGGVAFGLAGAAVVPMYMAIGQMIRHVGAGVAVVGHEHIPWKSFNLLQLTLDQAKGILIKPTWISIVGSPYVGPLGVIGVLLTGIYFRRLDTFLRSVVLAFGAIGLYGLLSGFGTNLGFAHVNFHLPFINRIRESGRHLVLFVIGVSVLSGLGYSLLAQTFRENKQSPHVRVLILPATLLVIFAATILWELFQSDQSWMPRRFWIMTLPPLLFALSYVCRLPDYRSVVPATALVSMAAAVVPVRGISISQSDFNKPMNLLSHRIIQDFVNKIDASGYRVDFRDNMFSNRFWAMNATYYGIKSFYNQLTPQPYDQFRFSLLANVPHLREMMGARYLLCGPNTPPIDQSAKEIFETEGYRLYENPKPMARLTLVHRIAGSANDEHDFTSLIRKGFDYFSEAYVTAADLNRARNFLGTSASRPHHRDRIASTVDQANRSFSTVDADSPSLLVLNEWFTPAWKVQVNGKKQPLLRVNQWQTGVLLDAGKNRVEFEYRPTLFRVLMVLHRITMVLLLVFVVFAISQKGSSLASNFATIA